jgi:hypothetical protein
MLESVASLSGELRDELAVNSEPAPIDTRSMPLRFGNLKAMGQSAAHCLQSFRYAESGSLAIRIGAGTHAVSFDQPFAVFGARRAGAVWEAFKLANADRPILNAKEMARAQAIAGSLRSNPLASRLLFSDGVKHEQTILWEQQGRARRSTPDARGFRYLVDLKTTRCAQPDQFGRDAMKRSYHAQLADYCDAIEAADGTRPTEVYIVAVESVPPYAVTVLRLTARALEQGARLCRMWFEQFIACEQSNAWPAYCESIVDLDVPDDDVGLVFGDDNDSNEGNEE